MIPLAAALAVTACATASSSPHAPPAEPALQSVAPPAPPCTGSCFPQHELVDLAGAHHDRTELAGHVIVVNVTATWVHPNKRGLPVLARASATYRSRGVKFFGVVTDMVPDEELASFTHAIPYPIVRMTAEVMGELELPQVLPTTVVFDRSGTQAARHVGPLDDETLAALLDPLLR